MTGPDSRCEAPDGLSMSGPASGPGTIKVLVVDDSVPFLSVAKRVIAATPGFEFAAGVTSAGEAFAVIDAAEPSLALVDVRMPGVNGIAATRHIRATHPQVRVVLISAQDPDQLPAAVHDCGAAALVRKQDLSRRLLSELWQDLPLGRRPRGSAVGGPSGK